MIARASATFLSHAPPAGGTRPQPHRFHLTSGRVVDGDIHRAPGGLLGDHLAALHGFITVTAARCGATGTPYGHVVLNQDHVMFVEELDRE